MTQLNIEFFHDVICSFCFPMSYRMRELHKEIPELAITHRSFALAPDKQALKAQFGSLSQAKTEILTHWQQANQNDTLHRFNIEGMKQTDFDFPTSMKGLRAAKAAESLGNYWDVFDALQEALFVKNLNIDDDTVLFEIIKSTPVDFDAWQTLYHAPETLSAVEDDFLRAQSYGLRGVPALVVEGKYLISGAQPKDYLLKTLKQMLHEKKETEIKPLEVVQDGETCRFVDGQWICD
ncbi:MAG TPA: DsbA family protein [Erysipelothrix sp.]|nr:DsbA family protein [Erysipelothrix sp.]